MKRVLSLILSVLMIASVMVLPTFAADTGKALNDLSDYGQKVFDATIAKTPTVNGTIASGEYSDSKAMYQVNNDQYSNIGPYTLYVAADASNIYFAAQFNEGSRGAQVQGNGGNMNLGSRFRLFINFPTQFTAKDANNYLVLSFNYAGNVTGVQAYGDSDFVAKMQASALSSLIAATPAAMNSGTAGNITNGLKAVGLVTAYSFSGLGGATAVYEIALSRAKLMEIFGWNGKTEMTYMASLATGYVSGTTTWRNYATQMADSKNYYNADGAAALEAYSAAKGDTTEVAPMVTQASNGVTMGNHADVIPDIVKFTIPVEEHALNDLAKYGQHQANLNEFKSPVINGAVASGEYSDSQNLYLVSNSTWGNIGPYEVYVAQDVDNIYFATVNHEGTRGATPTANGGNMGAGSALRLYINFPSEFTASDANNYLVFHFNYLRGNVTGVQAYGDAAFVAKMNEKMGTYISNTVTDFASGGGQNVNVLVDAGIVSGIASGVSGTDITFEVSFSKTAMMDIFGWDGKSDMTYMTWVREGNKPWATQMADAGVYYNASAAESLEAYSAANGDNTAVAPYVTAASGNGIVLGNNADVIPSVMKFANVNYGTMKDAASARLNSTDPTKSGLRFKSYWNDEFLAAYAGKDIEIGTLITLNSYVEQAGEFTHAALNALGVETPYVQAVAGEAFRENDAPEGMTTYAGSIVNLKSYTREYAARGYVKVDGVYFYTDNYVVRNIADIAQATLDTGFTADAADEVNVYEVVLTDGTVKYSKYTQSMYDQLVAFAG